MNSLNMIIKSGIGCLVCSFVFSCSDSPHNQNIQPNIVFILLDDIGYYELSSLGHEKLLTPGLDRMADEGMIFSHAYSGGNICAPSRSTLLTGQHLGQTTVRRNPGWVPLREDDFTIGDMLKEAGYATGGFGKWGIGDRGTTGVPENHGFDVFFGYYHQVHAHTYYPRYLIRNSEKVPLPGNTGAEYEGETHSQYLIFEETMDFIRENKDGPFFCYAPWPSPHAHFTVPEDDLSWQVFKDSTWVVRNERQPKDAQYRAALIHMVDRMIGDLLDLLVELEIDDNTLVIVAGDNGTQGWGASEEHPHGFFAPNGGRFRDGKGSLYEGGLRVPSIAWWPGRIKSGQFSDHIWYFPDMMPTFAELAGIEAPAHTNGISIVPTLVGEKQIGRKQESHEYLYWEYAGGRAVRSGNMKLVKKPLSGPGIQGQPYDSVEKMNQNPWELYVLSIDEGEQNNIADRHPEILEKLIQFAREAHTPVAEGSYYPGGKELGFRGHQYD